MRKDNSRPVFKVNDTIHIREWDDMASQYEIKDSGRSIRIPFTFTTEMRTFCGEEARITSVGYSQNKGQNYYVLDFVDILGNVDYYFGGEMFEESTPRYGNRPLWDKLTQRGEYNETLI